MSSLPPAAAWEKRAKDVILRAQELLWSPAGAESIVWDSSGSQTGAVQSIRLSPLDWLRARGLKDQTI